MKIAIDDKKYANKIENCVYVYENESIEDLLKLNIHCIHKDFIEEVDINTTKFNIPCLKKCNIDDDLTIELPEYKFAIIVPNYNNDHGDYNGKSFLRNCIESILNQTYKNFELIIIDDLSTDTSIETIESYKDKRIHLIKNNRKRYNGGSRNVGIDYAKTLDIDYICFLDSDDWWINDEVLECINKKLYNSEMMILGCQFLFPGERTQDYYNHFDTYEDVYFCVNKVWCTAWCRVIRKDKIVYFCENTLMEDRVWSYKQADNCEFSKIKNINKICYVWNRLNTTNSVSLVKGKIWDASAYCHIGHQLQFLETMKHKEFKSILRNRIDDCIENIKNGIYMQT